MKPSLHNFGTAAAMFAALALTFGCAQSLDEINRVQPNYSKKSDFLGKEFYARQTVVETQFTSAYGFPGAMSSTVRGVFEVQEKLLFFYRTYEFIQGSEAYAMKSDIDRPLLDGNGKPMTHAVLQDYMKISCTKGDTESVCGPGGWCADAANPKMADEGDFHGNCVREATRSDPRVSHLVALRHPLRLQHRHGREDQRQDREHHRSPLASARLHACGMGRRRQHFVRVRRDLC